MSQWGIERTVNGGRFIPLLSSRPFESASEESKVEDIMLVDDGGDYGVALQTAIELRHQFKGATYKKWSEARL